jgi:4-amino-4-deoxy-L-arabinose transferase-like glycosyltransferase
VLAFVLVVAPWYAWVGSETRGLFLKEFFLKHNRDRFLNPLEGHRGPVYYYLAVLVVGLAPWSAFLGAAIWDAVRQGKRRGENTNEDGSGSASPARFLGCWVAVYVAFFTAAGTKLPNYVLPAYPALALLTGHALDRWLRGELAVSPWAVKAGVATFGLVGAATAVGLLIAGGLLNGATLLRGRHLPGLEAWAAIGAVPLLGAVAAGLLARRSRVAAAGMLAASAAGFVALMGAGPATAVDSYKAPRPLAAAVRDALPAGDVRIACVGYFQPSLVFYCAREVSLLGDWQQATDLLRGPLPAYVFLPASLWDSAAGQVKTPCRVLGRHHDLYRNCDVVVVTNR